EFCSSDLLGVLAVSDGVGSELEGLCPGLPVVQRHRPGRERCPQPGGSFDGGTGSAGSGWVGAVGSTAVPELRSVSMRVSSQLISLSSCSRPCRCSSTV